MNKEKRQNKTGRFTRWQAATSQPQPFLNSRKITYWGKNNEKEKN